MSRAWVGRWVAWVLLACFHRSTAELTYVINEEWVTVHPPEYTGAINNPLKGFRDYKPRAYGLLKRLYIPWNKLEVCATDSVERIIAYTNQKTIQDGQPFENLNIKLIPRVFLDWNGRPGEQHWPADLHTFDYDSPEFHRRLCTLVAKLGEAWDRDPRIFAIQMGLIGHFGEHHSPSPTAAQRRMLAEVFRTAFKHKPILVRHTDPEFMEAGFGIYYDTFAYFDREPPHGDPGQFPWQATYRHPDIWKRAPIEGEVEYNWQKERASARASETFGRTPDETLLNPVYRHYMIDKIRKYHVSYLGWISGYNDRDPKVRSGAAELQKVFGYRFVLDSLRYPSMIHSNETLRIQLRVRNTGSAPFYLDWPVAVGLLDATHRTPVWYAPLNGIDIRQWMPGEDWDSEQFRYRRPPPLHTAVGSVQIPTNFPTGVYILAVSILDRQGGMVPSVRFAISNYIRGGWHPFGMIGVGCKPDRVELDSVAFDDPAFDPTLRYVVPASLRAVHTPPVPQFQPVEPWRPDPRTGLVNPWRYWDLIHAGWPGADFGVQKEILWNGPAWSATSRVVRVSGRFGPWTTLRPELGPGISFEPSTYRIAFHVRGTQGLTVSFEIRDSDRGGFMKPVQIPISSRWHQHTTEFSISQLLANPCLQFRFPKGAEGTFDLRDLQLWRTTP